MGVQRLPYEIEAIIREVRLSLLAFAIFQILFFAAFFFVFYPRGRLPPHIEERIGIPPNTTKSPSNHDDKVPNVKSHVSSPIDKDESKYKGNSGISMASQTHPISFMDDDIDDIEYPVLKAQSPTASTAHDNRGPGSLLKIINVVSDVIPVVKAEVVSFLFLNVPFVLVAWFSLVKLLNGGPSTPSTLTRERSKKRRKPSTKANRKKNKKKNKKKIKKREQQRETGAAEPATANTETTNPFRSVSSLRSGSLLPDHLSEASSSDPSDTTSQKGDTPEPTACLASDPPHAPPHEHNSAGINWTMEGPSAFDSREEEIAALNNGPNHISNVPYSELWILQYGIRYIPTETEKETHRTVRIPNIPDDVTLAQILPNISGEIYSAFLSDSLSLIGGKTALITFVNQKDAVRLVIRETGLDLEGGEKAFAYSEVRGIDTPTYPIPADLERLIREDGYTRCLIIKGQNRTSEYLEKGVLTVLQERRIKDTAPLECIKNGCEPGEICVKFLSIKGAALAFPFLHTSPEFVGCHFSFLKARPSAKGSTWTAPVPLNSWIWAPYRGVRPRPRRLEQIGELPE